MKTCNKDHHQIVYEEKSFEDEDWPDLECPLCEEIKRVESLEQACGHYRESMKYYKEIIYGKSEV